MTFDRITVRAEQMGGVPCIRGLQIPVATIIEMVADGMAREEILAAYPISSRQTSSKRCATRRRPCASASFQSPLVEIP